MSVVLDDIPFQSLLILKLGAPALVEEVALSPVGRHGTVAALGPLVLHV